VAGRLTLPGASAGRSRYRPTSSRAATCIRAGGRPTFINVRSLTTISPIIRHAAGTRRLGERTASAHRDDGPRSSSGTGSSGQTSTPATIFPAATLTKGLVVGDGCPTEQDDTCAREAGPAPQPRVGVHCPWSSQLLGAASRTQSCCGTATSGSSVYGNSAGHLRPFAPTIRVLTGIPCPRRWPPAAVRYFVAPAQCLPLLEFNGEVRLSVHRKSPATRFATRPGIGPADARR
jgi:hypothetical protein